MTRPACAGSDPSVFYSSGGTGQLSAARRLCGSCPLAVACLEHALRHEDHGIWAGTTPAGRRRLRRARGIRLEPYPDLLGVELNERSAWRQHHGQVAS